MSSRRSNVVAVVQPFVPTYRVGLFDALAEELGRRGLVLEVWHDQPQGEVAARGNAAAGPWSVSVRQHRRVVAGHNVTYRALHRRARSVSLVVAGLASGNVETYLLAADPAVRLALWGHGRNFTAKTSRADEFLESWLVKRAEHVLVYTPAGEQHLLAQGVAPDKLTVVMNSTDTRRIVDSRARATEQAVEALRRQWGLAGRNKVGMYVGAYHPSKRLDFLFAAADLVAARVPEFRLVVAGAGPDAEQVAQACRQRPYALEIGRVSEDQLGVWSHVVDLVMMPGRVGLVAVDALVMGTPIVTVDHDRHAPEVEYLDESVSSRTGDSVSQFAAEVERLLRDEGALNVMSTEALRRGRQFSAEAMAARFADGVDRALGRHQAGERARD